MILKGFNTSVEGITADVTKIESESELEVEPEEVTELLQSHDKILMGEELLFTDEKKVGFFRRNLLVKLL